MLKKIIISIIAVGIMLVTCGIWSIKDYMDRCPHIYPKENVTAKIGSTLVLDDLAEVKVLKGNHSFTTWIESDIVTKIEDAEVSKDGKSIFVGTISGSITVTIDARGLDDASAKQVTIIVSEQ